jgi:hypothetical protein
MTFAEKNGVFDDLGLELEEGLYFDLEYNATNLKFVTRSGS